MEGTTIMGAASAWAARQEANDRVLAEADARVREARAEMSSARSELHDAKVSRRETEFKLHDLIWSVEDLLEAAAEVELPEAVAKQIERLTTRTQEIKTAVRRGK